MNIQKEVEKTNRKIEKARSGLIAKINAYLRSKRKNIEETDNAILGLQDKRRADQADLEQAEKVLEEV